MSLVAVLFYHPFLLRLLLVWLLPCTDLASSCCTLSAKVVKYSYSMEWKRNCNKICCQHLQHQIKRPQLANSLFNVCSWFLVPAVHTSSLIWESLSMLSMWQIHFPLWSRICSMLIQSSAKFPSVIFLCTFCGLSQYFHLSGAVCCFPVGY
jgi:hypothetical protein